MDILLENQPFSIQPGIRKTSRIQDKYHHLIILEDIRHDR